jgi:hypothetical protein
LSFAKETAMDTNKQKQTSTIWYVVAAGLGALLLNQYWNISRQTDAISYSQFEQLVAGKKISAVKQGLGGLMTVGKSRAKVYVETDTKVTFKDVAGGRAAEVLLFEGDISTGAADDLQRATGIATEMVTLYGMAATVGQRTYKPAPQGFLSGQALYWPVASEATLREIDLSVRGIVADAFDEARAILTRRRADLDHGPNFYWRRKRSPRRIFRLSCRRKRTRGRPSRQRFRPDFFVAARISAWFLHHSPRRATHDIMLMFHFLFQGALPWNTVCPFHRQRAPRTIRSNEPMVASRRVSSFFAITRPTRCQKPMARSVWPGNNSTVTSPTILARPGSPAASLAVSAHRQFWRGFRASSSTPTAAPTILHSSCGFRTAI